jgi:hypothetical protein
VQAVEKQHEATERLLKDDKAALDKVLIVCAY